MVTVSESRELKERVFHRTLTKQRTQGHLYVNSLGGFDWDAAEKDAVSELLQEDTEKEKEGILKEAKLTNQLLSSILDALGGRRRGY